MSPWTSGTTAPSAATAVAGVGATRVTGPNAASAGVSASAIAARPARLRLPELIAAHASVRSSIAAASMRARTAASAAVGGWFEAKCAVTRAF